MHERIRKDLLDFRLNWRELALSLALGLVGALVFVELRIPLPWMIGPMFANMVAALCGLKLWVPGWLKLAMLMIVGALFGMTVTPDLIHHIPQWWPTVLLIVVFVILSVAAVTFYMRAIAKYDIVTSFFSATPGGMIAAIALAAAYRADVRIVSLSQSMRLIVTVFTIPIAFRLFADYQVSDAVADRKSVV